MPKIISWNLRNLGFGKLTNPMTATFAAYGLGNSVLDYIVNVVMGDAAWNNILTGNPADLFIIIELKTGGHLKGTPANGTSIPTANMLVGTMNAASIAAGTIGTYQYASVPALVTGRHECVGVIYNIHRFTYNAKQVLRDANVLYINPRTPYQVQFTENATAGVFNIVGIHAPPPKGGAAVKYKPPIDFARRMANMPALPTANQFVMGDYNCAPNSTYNTGGGPVGWNFVGYATPIPNGTLSSVRTKVFNANPAPGNYLSDAYDNMLYNFVPGGAVNEQVVDTIGNARDVSVMPPVALYPGSLPTVLRNYNKVSDHLPIVWEV